MVENEGFRRTKHIDHFIQECVDGEVVCLEYKPSTNLEADLFTCLRQRTTMRARMPRCRLFSTRILAILFLVLALGAYCYYSAPSSTKTANSLISGEDIEPRSPTIIRSTSVRKAQKAPVVEECPLLKESAADIDTVSTYPSFDFQPSWLRTKEFWDKSFEDRYEKYRNDSRRPMLKVIVVPHSHNDPGWLKTFEQYFEIKTKNILNNVVTKLDQYSNMTFIWTEISFLNAWWERSHPIKQKALKKLIKEGRVEITAGGWVMPDEACSHIYSIIDQFIEGHEWVKNNLGIIPKTGWSIDPFGHGPTVPYMLDKSGLEGTIIQRIHYAWKQWLAKRQIEEFHWMPGWSSKKPSLIVHNMPFDIYSIKASCGPHPSVCLSYDFRKIQGEYSEYTAKHEEITEQNLYPKSKTLIEEYGRIGSLTPHNVVLVPLGDDFRYEYSAEFDSQYNNYMKMFNYINDHKDLFNAEVKFGTPREYFDAVKERQKSVPTLKGDFFVYSEIFSEGKPAYWSGYYTTRPYIKILARQLEHQLRTSEILFTLVSNHVKQQKNPKLVASEKRLEKSYEQLINARRNLGLFQHHDAITGTSKASVMYRKDIKKKHIVDIQFGAYQSAQRHSGAYLFMPDYDAPEKNVLLQYANWNSLYDDNIIIVSGPISTEITTMYMPFLVHTARIYNVNDEALSHGVLFETVVDFESPPKNRETELFMRIQTDIQNGDIPEFYTDQNGFQYQKRVKVTTLGIEANYYPITTMAWLQDEDTRLTMITNHAQGAASFEPGRIELMLDRRTLYDDYRGIGEGVVDNRPTVFHNWMLLESMSPLTRRKREASEQQFIYTKERHFSPDQKESVYQLPSHAAEYLSKTLNYPVNIYMLDTSEVGEVVVNSHNSFVEQFPTGIHLVTLRTITDDILEQFPSSSCYMVLQRPGYSCSVGNTTSTKSSIFSPNTAFKGVNITDLTSVSLTGLKTYRSLAEMTEIELEPMEVKTYKVQF
ncbi:alpha-mannosidase 2x isoform X3 [Hyposmocoma kahamanoa]|uniref:alpha-mannosidase 2x isoform X3 n=1 Tax=Hyposmocoma kahamanoa TaxID=1477025 RepID=UPI000E6D6EEF|nr:alpha-mannosidase 2x isoform X3 [Hyposmocoma kahamanoa]